VFLICSGELIVAQTLKTNKVNDFKQETCFGNLTRFFCSTHLHKLSLVL
ncbi:MAG: hypothetical protein ACI9IZ_001990, partial [Nonlabens sp.]